MSKVETTREKVERYLNKTWSGKRLLETHKLSENGIWEIRGEDPNCDLGGHHYQPNLGTFEGKLEDVVLAAVDMPGFWTWGGGGDIKLVTIKPISAAKRMADLNKERDDLKKRIEEIELELKGVR